MRLQTHIMYSAGISGMLYLIFKSAGLSAACFISGIFIDLDHLPDVVREHGWSVGIREFFHICSRGQFDRIILLWHGWEWLLLLGAAAWSTGWNPWMTGIFAGALQHIVLDSLANTNSPWTYSLIWRWKKGFDFDTIFPKYRDVKYRYRNMPKIQEFEW